MSQRPEGTAGSRMLSAVRRPGGWVRNGWLTIPDAYLAEMVAACGEVDAVTLDMQHGLFDRRALIEALRAISGQGIASMVRLPQLDEALIGFVLDAGADGLILPGVDTADQAAAFVAACRYPPSGSRSHGPTRRALTKAAFPAVDAVTFAMIETRAGLRAVSDIASVKGLVGLFVGPGDLGIALGLGPGQDRSEPEFENALQAIRTAAEQGGKALGIHAATTTYASRMARSGFGLVTTWVDVTAIKASLARTAQDWSAV